MIDFIDPVAWPAFNVADSCIVVGVFLLLWVVEGAGDGLRRPDRRRRGRRPAPGRLPRGPRSNPLAGGRPAADRGGRGDGRRTPRGRRTIASPRASGSSWLPPRRSRPGPRRRRRRSRSSTRTSTCSSSTSPPGSSPIPAPGHDGATLAEALAGRAAGGRRPGARRHRPPARPRHVRAARRGAHRRGARGAPADAAGPRDHARVPGARGGPSGRRDAARSTPRSAVTGPGGRRCRPAPTARAARSPTSRCSSGCHAPRCCGSGSRPGGPTRSAPTSRRSAIRCAAIPPTAAPNAVADLASTRQFLHAARLMFKHPITRANIACESKPPVDLRHALDVARREPVSGGPDGD